MRVRADALWAAGLLILALLAVPSSARAVAGGWTHPIPPRTFNDWHFGSCDGHYEAGVAHLGTDSQGAAVGQAVVSLGSGTVRALSSGWPGDAVGVEHAAGDGSRFLAVYGHIDRSVGRGAVLAPGQQIGTLTSWPGNQHLHLGIRPLAPGEVPTDAMVKGRSACSGGSAPLLGYVNPIPWLAAHGPGSVAEGSFVAREGSGAVYRIAGGAPIYVSDWAHFGGPQPVTVMAPAAFDALRGVPADGTFIHTVQDGAVYRIAGGAPIYVSTWDTYGGPQPTVGIDKWAVDNPGHPAAHLRAVPADRTFVSTQDGAVYRIAGGAPVYVSRWDAVGGEQPTVGIDKWAVDNTGHPAAHLRSVPANGTFLNSSSGAVYRVAGGAPIYVSDWALFGGVRPHVTIDEWAIENRAHPAAHLNRNPSDGTVVKGLPSRSHWRFRSGQRTPAAAVSSAVEVDDAGLAAFLRAGTAGPAAGSASPPRGSSAPVPAGASAAVRARVTRLRWAGRTLRMRVHCPAAAPSSCAVRLSLRAPAGAARRFRTVSKRSLRLARGAGRRVVLRAPGTARSRRRLSLRVQTDTSGGRAVGIVRRLRR